MAVYTHVDEPALRSLLAFYDIGDLVSFSGIAEGVENTNYAVETTRGKFILTLFEKRVDEADLPFFLSLMNHFARAALPVPAPVPDKEGRVLQRLCNRPAIIITFLSGRPHMTPTPHDCASLGATLADMHLAAETFKPERVNILGLSGWKKLARQCATDADRCAAGLGDLIADEIAFLDRQWPDGLPAGAVHADLFPDNVFFERNKVTGVIDFYFSCTDSFAYDLAICLNAWSSINGAWSQDNASAILASYQRTRPLSKEELHAVPILLRGAALRFLLTRLYDWINQVDGAVVTVKDPLEYRDLLITHRDRQKPPSNGNSMLEIYTDGACSGNPGPGGWGVLILENGDERELSGGEAETTNNRMELKAAIEALKATSNAKAVSIYTDSQYVKNGITTWMAGWKRNGWKTSAKKPVKNKDLWEALDEATRAREIEWRWVKGHDGDAGNERADELARQGMSPYLD